MNYSSLSLIMIFGTVMFCMGLTYQKHQRSNQWSECTNTLLVELENKVDHDAYFKFPKGLISKFSFESIMILLETEHNSKLHKCMEENK